MNKADIIPFIEPIYRFCLRKCNSQYDAEDLSGEIICHIVNGMDKYHIESLEGWVWRIAHNRYARWTDTRSKEKMVFCDAELYDIADSDYCYVDTDFIENEYNSVFRYLHTLSAEYRNIIVDHYIGEMSVRQLSIKHSLPETTIKWRLNDGRRKIRERIGDNKMDKIYQRINWNTTCCNGSMDSDRYLHTQISRAICKAAYDKPLTVEEISLVTGIPAMYIEDELPRLEYGDAIQKIGSKYATDFIVFSLQNRLNIEKISMNLVNSIADSFERTFKKNICNESAFYGHEFGIKRLGYILIPYILRKKVSEIKQQMNMSSGNYPPRKDGGYGWFIVEETADEKENCAEYNSGCNVAGDDSGSGSPSQGQIYYYWIAKYFDNNIYHNGGTRWLTANGIPQNSQNGAVPKEALTEDDAIRLLKTNLIIKSNDEYQMNFPCFSQDEFQKFVSNYEIEDDNLNKMISEWIVSVKKSFESFVPKRLYTQINQWISGYAGQIIGCVTDEMIHRGILKKPDETKTFSDGVFYVEGKYINP